MIEGHGKVCSMVEGQGKRSQQGLELWKSHGKVIYSSKSGLRLSYSLIQTHFAERVLSPKPGLGFE